MPAPTQHKSRTEPGVCPICGDEADDVVQMAEATRENETMPAVAYDHDGEPLHIEWADGELTQG